MREKIQFTVNGKQYKLSINVKQTLLEVLRDDLGLTGTKYGCGQGECGACTVLVNGKAASSCLTMAASVNGKDIITIEGLEKDGELHPLQDNFVKHGAVECGFCTPGMIMTAKALLDENPNPTKEEVRHYLGGNLCRCTGYDRIVDVVLATSKEIRGGNRIG